MSRRLKYDGIFDPLERLQPSRQVSQRCTLTCDLDDVAPATNYDERMFVAQLDNVVQFLVVREPRSIDDGAVATLPQGDAWIRPPCVLVRRSARGDDASLR